MTLTKDEIRLAIEILKGWAKDLNDYPRGSIPMIPFRPSRNPVTAIYVRRHDLFGANNLSIKEHIYDSAKSEDSYNDLIGAIGRLTRAARTGLAKRTGRLPRSWRYSCPLLLIQALEKHL